MHEEDLWSDLADDLSSSVPSNTAPKHAISTAISAVSKPASKKSNSNEAIFHVNLPPGPMQPPSPLTPLPPSQPILEDLWDKTSDASLTDGLLDLTTPVIESLPGLEQETSGSEDTLGEQASPELAPDEEADDLFEADLWKVWGEEEDEARFEEETSDVLDELETSSLQEDRDGFADGSTASSSSAQETISDFFATLEQSTPPPGFESREDADTLLANFGLLDIEAELAEQERLEAETASQEAEAKTTDSPWRERAPAWMKTLSVIYIDWQNPRKAEQEALERLCYSNLPISKETRAFIIQAARAARLIHQREKELTNELDQVRSQLAPLSQTNGIETKIQVLKEEIAEIESELGSATLLWQRKKQLTAQLEFACSTLKSFLSEEAECHTLKAKIAGIECELATSMQWVAIKRAPHFLGQGVELDDLIQYGMIGIIAGIRHFDRMRGAKLLSVVSWWVLQALTRAVADYGHPIRLPTYVHEALAQVKKQYTDMEMRLGRKPTRQELAAAAQWSIKRLEEVLRADRKMVSLNHYMDAEEDNEGFSFQSVEEALVQGEDSISADIEQEGIQKTINALLNCLTLRERQVVELRYGLFDYEEHTLEETGRRLKVTRERVRQIQERAEKKLNWYSYRLKLHQRLAPSKTKTKHKVS